MLSYVFAGGDLRRQNPFLPGCGKKWVLDPKKDNPGTHAFAPPGAEEAKTCVPQWSENARIGVSPKHFPGTARWAEGPRDPSPPCGTGRVLPSPYVQPWHYPDLASRFSPFGEPAHANAGSPGGSRAL